MTLWGWALQAYARPGVAEACLVLQDEHGQCVSYLLWAAWAAAEGRSVNADALAQGAALARTWEQTAVGPLRQVRRHLKSQAPGMDDGARQAVRAQVKAAELAAERALMQALEGLAPPGGKRARLSVQVLADAVQAWGAAAPLEALLALTENLV